MNAKGNLTGFFLAWSLIALMYWDELLLTLILELLAVGLILNSNDSKVVRNYVLGSMAYFLEYVPVLAGAWTYCDCIFGVPLWISPLAGITFITIVSITSGDK